MTAEIVSVGTELLLGQIVDTHAPVLAEMLAGCGIVCLRRVTLGDNYDRLVAGLKESLSRADLVVTIGGLGPTQDDLTRDAIAGALDDELVHVPEVEVALRTFFAQRNMAFTESNARQAFRPASAELIDNPNGTAPGLLCRKHGKTVIALPGPAGEFNPMAKGPVLTYLQGASGGGVIHSRTLRVDGIGESAAEAQIVHLMQSENPTVAPYAHLYEVHLRITAKAGSVAQANALIDPMEASIRQILGSAVYGIDDTTLEMAVVDELTKRKMTVAVAESITGGGLGKRITNAPGSSKVFLGGVIAYAPSTKIDLLGIDVGVIDQFGPVSAETAQAMAEAVRISLGADFGIGATGNAGPDSDIDGKPVGLSYVAIASSSGTRIQEAKYRGIREDIRRRVTQLAIRMLREALLG